MIISKELKQIKIEDIVIIINKYPNVKLKRNYVTLDVVLKLKIME